MGRAIFVLLFTCSVVPLISLNAYSNDLRVSDEVQKALLGKWAGYLEYRDYSEPPASTKRVQLPSWLTISETPGGLNFHYIYDDGPKKVVEENQQVSFDSVHNIYTIVESGHPTDVYRVEGFATLRNGLGTLVFSGSGSDNNKPAEQRITFTIRRNIIEWALETRPAGSAEPFAFRHLYRFVRSQAPAVVSPPG